MEVLAIAAAFAAFGTVLLVAALRFRKGGVDRLRHQPYRGSLWPAARRNIAFALLPAAGLCLVTAASVVAQVAGLKGVVFSAAYLVLVLALLVMAVVFTVKRPRWLGSLEPPPGPPGAQAPAGSVEQPPRPISEMTGQELADWAEGDPEKLRRLLPPRRSAAASAFGPAFVLVMLGAAGYGVLIRGDGLLDKLTLAETLTVGVSVLVAWLVFWILIAARRRRSDRQTTGKA